MADHTEIMSDAEVLRLAVPFDPTQVDPANVYRLALEVIARTAHDAEFMRGMAALALKEIDDRVAA